MNQYLGLIIPFPGHYSELETTFYKSEKGGGYMVLKITACDVPEKGGLTNGVPSYKFCFEQGSNNLNATTFS